MSDSRHLALARTVMRHSTRLQPGEAVLIDAFDADDGLVTALVDEAYACGGLPLVQLRRSTIVRRHLRAGREAQIRLSAEIELSQMEQVQAYVGLRGADNSSELSDVPARAAWRCTRSSSSQPGAPRLPRQPHALGGAALADAVDGAARRT